MVMSNLQFGMNRVCNPKRADISAVPVIPIILRDTMRGISMKQIELTQGKVALVDDSDFEWLNQWKWHAQKHHSGTFYAMHSYVYKGTKRRSLSMARLLLGLQRYDKKEVDHKNRNPLDNCRCNLRIATKDQNQQNKSPHRNSVSKYKGVSWHGNKWVSRISPNKNTVCLGHFCNEIDAARAYDTKAKEVFGEFACLNFPMDLEELKRLRPK